MGISLIEADAVHRLIRLYTYRLKGGGCLVYISNPFRLLFAFLGGSLRKYSMPECRGPENIVVYITAPKEEDAARIAQALVKAKLAACVNIVRNIRSIYSWQGKIEDAAEVLMIVKTQKKHFDALSEKVRELHSYDVPEIIALPILKGSDDYLEWIRASTE